MTRYFLAAAALALSAASVSAHHSFAATFDVNQPITITGKIVEMRWSNPHAWIYVEAAEADGKLVKWAFETSAANQLYRRGWRREHIVPGTEVTISGWRARNGTPTGNVDTIKLPDGKEMFSGAAPGQPAER